MICFVILVALPVIQSIDYCDPSIGKIFTAYGKEYGCPKNTTGFGYKSVNGIEVALCSRYSSSESESAQDCNEESTP